MPKGKYITHYYEEAIAKAKSSIRGEQDGYIAKVDTKELVEYYYSEIRLEKLEFDPTREKYMETDKKLEIVRAGTYISYRILTEDTEIERDVVIIYIPVIPNENFTTIWEMMPSTKLSSGSPPLLYDSKGWVYFKLYLRPLQLHYVEDLLAQEIQEYEQRVDKYFEFRNKDIEEGERKYKDQVSEFITHRKHLIKAKENKLNSLTKRINIPLRRKEDSIEERIKLNEKPLIKRIKPEAKLPEEYVLNREKVLDIIQYIDNQGLQFEKTPRAFSTLGEEDLRDILLVNLNSIFEGRATGETFSAKGRSDIYLNLEKGNILVFECKIWKGLKQFHKTIDQLLGYLTWRLNYGVIIFFSRNSNFTDILSQVEDIIEDHESYLRGAKKVKDTHYISVNRLSTDEFKEVEIHFLFYNLYVGK
jgi:hypothetical protein